jgi:hypothetical protein
MKRRTRLSDARVPVMHASAIVVSGPTTGDRSAGASTSAATYFAARSAPTPTSAVSAAKTTTTTEYASMTSGPASMSNGDRCDAD